MSAHLLWRHIAYSAHHRSRIGLWHLCRRTRIDTLRQLLWFELGKAEVENLDSCILGYEQVLRLEIAMGDPFLVRGGQATGDLLSIVNDFSKRKRAVIQLLA